VSVPFCLWNLVKHRLRLSVSMLMMWFHLHKVVGYKRVIAERYYSNELDPTGKYNPHLRMYLLKVTDESIPDLMRLSSQVNDTMTTGVYKSSFSQTLMELLRTLRTLTPKVVNNVFDDKVGVGIRI
jgi:hypothetical protein